MRSKIAQVFLLVAFLYAVFTAGELWLTVRMVVEAYATDQEKIFQGSAAIVRWIVDPAFLCGTAVMIEFLERIWRELAKANAARSDGQ